MASSSSPSSSVPQPTQMEPIVLTLEAKFHGVMTGGWTTKLIRFPKGGLLWGLHLEKTQNAAKTDKKIVVSAFCYGPTKKKYQHRLWSISFDHAFTLNYRRVITASQICKFSSFNRSMQVCRAGEWGDERLPLPKNWGIHDNVRLSCLMFISQTTGLDRDALAAAGSPIPLNPLVKPSPSPSNGFLTPSEIESEVMDTITDLLTEEHIVYTDEGFAASEKLVEFFCHKGVLDICRRHLIRIQTLLKKSTCPAKDGEKKFKSINMRGFDYPTNSPSRRIRASNLSEDDVIDMFIHLTSIVYKTP